MAAPNMGWKSAIRQTGSLRDAKHVPARGGEGEGSAPFAGFGRVDPALGFCHRTPGPREDGLLTPPSPPGEEREKTRTPSVASCHAPVEFSGSSGSLSCLRGQV